MIHPVASSSFWTSVGDASSSCLQKLSNLVRRIRDACLNFFRTIFPFLFKKPQAQLPQAQVVAVPAALPVQAIAAAILPAPARVPQPQQAAALEAEVPAPLPVEVAAAPALADLEPAPELAPQPRQAAALEAEVPAPLPVEVAAAPALADLEPAPELAPQPRQAAALEAEVPAPLPMEVAAAVRADLEPAVEPVLEPVPQPRQDAVLGVVAPAPLPMEAVAAPAPFAPAFDSQNDQPPREASSSESIAAFEDADDHFDEYEEVPYPAPAGESAFEPAHQPLVSGSDGNFQPLSAPRGNEQGEASSALQPELDAVTTVPVTPRPASQLSQTPALSTSGTEQTYGQLLRKGVPPSVDDDGEIPTRRGLSLPQRIDASESSEQAQAGENPWIAEILGARKLNEQTAYAAPFIIMAIFRAFFIEGRTMNKLELIRQMAAGCDAADRAVEQEDLSQDTLIAQNQLRAIELVNFSQAAIDQNQIRATELINFSEARNVTLVRSKLIPNKVTSTYRERLKQIVNAMREHASQTSVGALFSVGEKGDQKVFGIAVFSTENGQRYLVINPFGITKKDPISLQITEEEKTKKEEKDFISLRVFDDRERFVTHLTNLEPNTPENSKPYQAKAFFFFPPEPALQPALKPCTSPTAVSPLDEPAEAADVSPTSATELERDAELAEGEEPAVRTSPPTKNKRRKKTKKPSELNTVS